MYSLTDQCNGCELQDSQQCHRSSREEFENFIMVLVTGCGTFKSLS